VSTWSPGVCLRSSLADDGAVTSLPVDVGTELAAASTSVTGVNEDIDATDNAAAAAAAWPLHASAVNQSIT